METKTKEKEIPEEELDKVSGGGWRVSLYQPDFSLGGPDPKPHHPQEPSKNPFDKPAPSIRKD